LAAFLKALHVEAPADAPGASDFGTHPKHSRGGFEHFLGRRGPRRLGLRLRRGRHPGRVGRRRGDPEADEATIRRARGLAAMKSLFLMLMGQNGDRGPGGKPNWGPQPVST